MSKDTKIWGFKLGVVIVGNEQVRIQLPVGVRIRRDLNPYYPSDEEWIPVRDELGIKELARIDVI